MSYVATVWHSVYALDPTKLRRWSALRRGILVIVTLMVVGLLTDAETGALASVSSLYVGLQDRNASASYTSRVMVVQSFVFAGVVLVGGALSHIWVVPVALLTGTAVVAGLAAQHDKAISRMFGDVMAVAAFLGLSSVDPRAAVVSAVAVLAAGLAQAVIARLWVRVEGDLLERRPVAAALIAVADHLDDALVRASRTTGRAAEDRLTAAGSALATSDLAHDRRRALRRLLADAEVLRQEAAALRIRRARHLDVAHETEVVEALTVASMALRATAAALLSVRMPGRYDYHAEESLAELYPCRIVAEAVAEDVAADPTARSISRQTLRLYRHVSKVVMAPEARSRKRSRRVGAGMSQYLLHPTPRDVLSGSRLGAATLISFALAHVLDVPHGAWVAATAVALLRPDYRALTTDTVARAIGTAGGALLAVPLVWVTMGQDWAELFLVFLLATATFAITAVNEGLYVLASTVETIVTRAVVGEDPVLAAIARMEDVVLGTVIAVAFIVLVPLSHGRRLASDLAKYASAVAAWLAAIAAPAERARGDGAGGDGALVDGGAPDGGAAEGATEGGTPSAGARGAGARGADPATHWKAVRRDARNARVQVQHGLELRVIEPMGPGLSSWRAEIIFTRVHEAARVAAAVERSLKHGEPLGPQAQMLAADAAATLEEVARVLHEHDFPAQVAQPPEVPTDEGDAIAALLRHADHEAHAALQAVRRPPVQAHAGG